MKIFERPLKQLKLVGWSENKIPKFRAALLIIMHFWFVEFIAIGEIISLFTSENSGDFSEIFALIPTFLGLSLKSFNLLWMKNKMHKLFKTLPDLIHYENWIVAQEGTKLKQRIEQLDIFSKITFGLMIAALFFGSLVPFFTRKIIYKMWLPYDYKSSDFLLWLSVAYQFLASYIYLTILFPLDFIPVFLIFYVVGLTEELSDKLRRIVEKKLSAKNEAIFASSSNRPVVTDHVNTKEENEAHLKELLQCIEIQLKIKSLVADIIEIYSKMFWLQGFFSSWVLCTTVFWMSLVRCFLNIFNNLISTFKSFPRTLREQL